MREAIFTEKGAAPRGLYSQAIVAQGPQVFVSAQGPNDPETGQRVTGSFAEQAERVFQNVTILLEAAGTSWAHVVKVNVYLADSSNFAEMNQIYGRYCVQPYPARTTLEATVGGAAILVDCVALVPQSAQ